MEPDGGVAIALDHLDWTTGITVRHFMHAHARVIPVAELSLSLLRHLFTIARELSGRLKAAEHLFDNTHIQTHLGRDARRSSAKVVRTEVRASLWVLRHAVDKIFRNNTSCRKRSLETTGDGGTQHGNETSRSSKARCGVAGGDSNES